MNYNQKRIYVEEAFFLYNVDFVVVYLLRGLSILKQNLNIYQRQLAATTLRNTLGLHTLQEILQEKEKIAHSMQEHLDNTTHAWYVFL